jgi:SAM-dependent methyltransferase
MTGPFDNMAARYDDLVGAHGNSHRSCDWGSSGSQEVRFDVLTAVADLSGCSILDVGCGLGDLARFLNERCAFDPPPRYTGIDISTEMVRHARNRDPTLDIRQANIVDGDLGSFDVVVASGIFGFLPPDRFDLMEQVVRAMYQRSRQAVAFNSLSSWAPRRYADELHADPLRTIEFCRTLTSKIILRHDYHTRDFSVYMYTKPA